MRLTGRVWWIGITALGSVGLGIVIDHGFLRIFGFLWIILIFVVYFYHLYCLKRWLGKLQIQASFGKHLTGRIGEPLELQMEGRFLSPGGFWNVTAEPVVTGRYRWDMTREKPWVFSPGGLWQRTRYCVPAFAGFVEILGFRVMGWDVFGWYETVVFLPFRKRIPVCPSRMAGTKSSRGGKKASNLLWKPGIFQVDRSGKSLEFLGLREFVAGDSPRRIAWKPSLRRDSLLVRETEWEVPIVVNCLVDAGMANRFRHDGQMSDFDEFQGLIMTVAQAAMESSNPFSLALVDPGNEAHLKSGIGKIHLTKTELAIAEKSAQIPPNPSAAPDTILPEAELLLESLYPSEMDPFGNRLPLWNSWIEGFPAWSPHSDWRRKLDARRWLFWFAGPLGWIFLPVVFGLTEKERKLSLARKRVARLLCSLGKLPPGSFERLLQDDSYFSETLTWQLGSMGLTLSAAGGDPVATLEEQLLMGNHLGGTLMQKVSQAKDQQVFIVLIQSKTLYLGMGPLIEALKRARCLGHRVMVLDVVSTRAAGKLSLSMGSSLLDLKEVIQKSGVAYIHGTPPEVQNRFESQIQKEGFLGRR